MVQFRFPTATSPPPSPVPPSPTPVQCNWAQFIGDVSVNDKVTFPPGANFVKTWRLKNIGSCTWTPQYSLVYVGGDPLTGTLAVVLPGSVRPGEVMDVSVSLAAPGVSGTYKWYWMLRDASGALFGFDEAATSSFWLQIQVIPPAVSDDYAYDFAANYCNAEWSSGAGSLSCPGLEDDPNGSVIYLAEPYLEARRENEPALWVRPDADAQGWISGQFPPYRVKDGDRILVEVGCLIDSQGCDLIFQLEYRVDDGTIKRLGAWQEEFDGFTTQIVVDVSALADKEVQFILRVVNNGRSRDANAFWFVPHIENVTPAIDIVLMWHQQGGEDLSCDELEIYLTDDESEALAISCKGGRQELGTIRLSDEDASRLQGWIKRMKSFDAEVFRPSSGEPLVTWISFRGEGGVDATNGDIHSMRGLAERIFDYIDR